MASASAKTGSPAATATDPVLYTRLVQTAPGSVLARMMLSVIPQMDPVLAPLAGWVLTVRSPVKRASTARIANTTVTARMGQSVIRLLANVIVLGAGAEYFVTLSVPREDSEQSVMRSAIV